MILSTQLQSSTCTYENRQQTRVVILKAIDKSPQLYERNQVHTRIEIHEQWLLELEIRHSIQLNERNQVPMRIEIHEECLLELTSHYTVSLDERNQVHTWIKIPERHIGEIVLAVDEPLQLYKRNQVHIRIQVT